MNERLQQYKIHIQEKWNGFSNKQKLIISSVILFFLISLGLYIYVASRPVYVSLFQQGLSEQEIGTIKQELEANKIDYRVTNNGTGIEVPQVIAQDVIVDLAAKGIPSTAGISTEIFTGTSSFGITDRQFEVLKKDALQLELKKMLERVKGVKGAQVMLTLPEEDVWVTETEDQASASVIVEIEPGKKLTDEQTRALYYIVSRSVPNLPLEQITITDQYSNLLKLPDSDESANSLTAYQQQEKIKAQVQEQIQKDIYNFLGVIMGRDKVIVQTAVKMDFAKENREEKLVTAPDTTNNEGLIISAKRLSETFSGQGTPPGGTAGTGQNDVPSFPGANQQGTNSEYEKTDDIVNREVNRITRNVVESPYKIVDLSINVGVEPPDGGQLDEQTMENIRQVLRNVVKVTLSEKGVQLTQADLDERITVFPRTFSGKVVVDNQSTLSPTLLYGVGALALLALGAVGYLVYRRRKQAQMKADIPDIPEPQPFDVPDLQYDENSDEVVVRKQLEKLARSKPDEFVVLLRTWLAED